MNTIITVSILALLLFLLAFQFEQKNNKVKQSIKKQKQSIAITIIDERNKLKNETDSIVKNVLTTMELGANITGCFYGDCGGGTQTIGWITKYIN